MKIDSTKLEQIVTPIITSSRFLGILTLENNVLKFNRKKFESLTLHDVKVHFSQLIMMSFAGRGSTTPGYSNIGLDFDREERLQSPYKFNINDTIPKDKKKFNEKYKDKMTSAHIGQERTPAKIKKFHEAGKNDNDYEVKVRLGYILTMVNGKNIESAIKEVGSFEYDRQRRGRVMCLKGRSSTQENNFDKLISKTTKEFEVLLKSEQKRIFKNLPESSIKNLVPLIVMGKENQFHITTTFDDSPITIFEFIKETDVWAVKEFKSRFNEEFPFLTDEMINSFVDFYSSFLKEDKIKELRKMFF